MSDEQSSDPKPHDPSHSAPSEQVSEGQLDAVLNEAAALAGDLSDQIGAPESPSSPSDSLEQNPDDADIADRDIDADLNEIDRLLTSTEGDVGSVPPPDPGHADVGIGTADAPSHTEPSNPMTTPEEGVVPDIGADISHQPQASRDSESQATKSGDGDDVPSFMSEFTADTPQAPQGGSSAVETTNVDADVDAERQNTPIPGVVATGIVGSHVASEADETSDQEDRPATSSEAPAHENREQEERQDEPTGGTDSSRSWLAVRLERPVQTISHHGVSLLEALDQPVQGVGAGTRRYIGWLALATLGTAVIVYLISLF